MFLGRHRDVTHPSLHCAAGVADDGAKQYTLAYNYNITNTTKLYVFYTAVNNDTGGTYFTGAPAADFTSLAVGFRHNF